eukprot:CAMPEP_0169476306 /NCGR_PEP_ID=MMETSP1042-20121227/27295_1 /TAXON_ID=464988 /ORGANISM="Hemiselmis andersenii, Strain CCMP1180" /LENGTH=105 /DNA_ID=CAMNT_0009590545 /DNA_START=488 /DNA_END=805 /DNA_ORIENTATION=-
MSGTDAALRAGVDCLSAGLPPTTVAAPNACSSAHKKLVPLPPRSKTMPGFSLAPIFPFAVPHTSSGPRAPSGSAACSSGVVQSARRTSSRSAWSTLGKFICVCGC